MCLFKSVSELTRGLGAFESAYIAGGVRLNVELAGITDEWLPFANLPPPVVTLSGSLPAQFYENCIRFTKGFYGCYNISAGGRCEG